MSLTWRRQRLGVAMLVLVGSQFACSADGPTRDVPPPPPPGTARIALPESPLNTAAIEVDDELVDPAPKEPFKAQTGVLGAVTTIVDRAQQNATERFGAFVFQLDDFFGGDTPGEEPNTSFLRVRLDAVRPVIGGFEADPAAKLRIVLPRAEQRFRLLLSTEDSVEASDEAERVAGTSNDESASLALRFVRRARDSGKLDFDLGVRQREGLLQLFSRIRAEYRDDLSEFWQTRISNRYFYFFRTGFENRLQFDFTRRLGPLDENRSRFFRSTTTFDWQASRQGASISQTLGVYLGLGEQRALAIEALGSYDTELNEDTTERFLGAEFRLRYRRNLWRPWLFVELWPSIAWPAERDYRRTFNGLARIEIVIGGNDLLPLQEARH